MVNTREIVAAKDERARKRYLKAILDKHGVEALYAELYAQTIEGMVDLPYDYEDELYAAVQARIPEERQAEIRAEVDAPEPDPDPTAAELERARRAQEIEAQRQEAWYAAERKAAK